MVDVLLLQYPLFMIIAYVYVKLLKCCGLVSRRSIVAMAAEGILFSLCFFGLTVLCGITLLLPVYTFGVSLSLAHIFHPVCFGVAVAYEAFGYSKTKELSRRITAHSGSTAGPVQAQSTKG